MLHNKEVSNVMLIIIDRRYDAGSIRVLFRVRPGHSCLGLYRQHESSGMNMLCIS